MPVTVFIKVTEPVPDAITAPDGVVPRTVISLPDDPPVLVMVRVCPVVVPLIVLYSPAKTQVVMVCTTPVVVRVTVPN